MASNYPSALDSYSTLTDNVDDVLASHANDRGDAIENLEAKVGIDSSSASTSLDYFLKHVSGAYRTHVHDGTSDDGASLSYRTTFVNADLSAGNLTITHNLNKQVSAIFIFDNNNDMIIPDNIDITGANTSTVNLSSFGTLSGTWNLLVLR